ncbi:MAG: hypothetical protein M3Q37_09690 [Gemmatimonadota bacterium]|nr:hypothetical protein [Gemmatimonadota bacterium]
MSALLGWSIVVTGPTPSLGVGKVSRSRSSQPIASSSADPVASLLQRIPLVRVRRQLLFFGIAKK